MHASRAFTCIHHCKGLQKIHSQHSALSLLWQVWHPSGIIRVFGVLDYAGGTVVHMSSGFAGLAAAKYLGHSLAAAGRQAKGDADAHVFWWDSAEPANVPIVVLGTTLLWVGWFGVSFTASISFSLYLLVQSAGSLLCTLPKCGSSSKHEQLADCTTAPILVMFATLKLFSRHKHA
jgi:hypothetical protein